MIKLAITLVHSQKYEEALDLYEDSVFLQKKNSNVKPKYEKKFINEKYDIKHPLALRALKVFEKNYYFYNSIWGKNHVQTAQIIEYRGMLFHALHYYELAKLYYDDTKAVYDKLLDPRNERNVRLLNNIS